MTDIGKLEALARRVRRDVLFMTEKAGSGHPTSSLSAADLLTALMFGGFFRFFPDDPAHPNNDRLIFSKGHATPLLYALWAAAGRLSQEDLEGYRTFGSSLEGHPTPRFRYNEVATGSLGQGLPVGLGMALDGKLVEGLPFRTFVLLGDSEMAEGSQWEALQLAAHYELDNLVGILDVNGLGQTRETMYGRDLEAYRRRIEPFGWDVTLVDDGHDMRQVTAAFARALRGGRAPKMIVARTVKGKGVPSVEGKNGFHGKALGPEAFAEARKLLGEFDPELHGELGRPDDVRPKRPARQARAQMKPYALGDKVATREAYGRALAALAPDMPDLVVLDGEVGNSTHAQEFEKAHPERFFEMYIAEQNMVGAALGLSARGRVPFVSTFAAFFSRAYDQVRMCQYSRGNVKFCGSHAGVEIGPDGPSQMGLEDLAMFRSVLGSTVLYPADAVAMEKLVAEAACRRGLVYLRSTRGKTPVIYGPEETFPVGGNKVLRSAPDDAVAIVSAGVCLFEALKAHDRLKKDGVQARVIDQYTVKPVDAALLRASLGPARAVLTVEDHHAEGGLGDAVLAALSDAGLTVRGLGVERLPRSGKTAELFEYEEISAAAIARAARELASGRPRRGRPEGLKTRIFLDGGDPRETRELLDLLGFLDGQTTNPTLLAKNPDVKARLESGGRVPEDALLERYRDVVSQISELIPDGSVSVEVYADPGTTEEEMLRQGRRMSSWIPNAHVKFPSSVPGLEAASRAVAEGLRVNMTLCFSQEQAAAIHSATAGAARGQVFVSPFVGRLDDRGEEGMDLVANVLRMYRAGDGHVEVLAASVRTLDHLLYAISLGSPIATAPFKVLREWAEKGTPLPGPDYRFPRDPRRAPIEYRELRLDRPWREYDLRHELTRIGEEKFSKDWNALLARRHVPAA